MAAYDPLTAPDPDTWQAIDEAGRIGLVMAHHRAAGAELPNERLHATIHVVIENQVAMGEEIPVRATLARLMREGPKHERLTRHDAIHAVCSALAGFLHELLGDAAGGPAANARYYAALAKLTAAKWRNSFR